MYLKWGNTVTYIFSYLNWFVQNSDQNIFPFSFLWLRSGGPAFNSVGIFIHSMYLLLLTISAIYMSLQSLKFLHHCILVITPWSAYKFLNLVWTWKYLRFKRKLTINYLVSWCTSLRMCSTSSAGCPNSKWYTLKGQFGNQNWPLSLKYVLIRI